MYDWNTDVEKDKIAFWDKQPTDTVGCLNSFDGTWDIRNHDDIPNSLLDFIMEKFNTIWLKQIPLGKINSLLNEVWEGSGSMSKIVQLTYEIKRDRKK